MIFPDKKLIGKCLILFVKPPPLFLGFLVKSQVVCDGISLLLVIILRFDIYKVRVDGSQLIQTISIVYSKATVGLTDLFMNY